MNVRGAAELVLVAGPDNEVLVGAPRSAKNVESDGVASTNLGGVVKLVADREDGELVTALLAALMVVARVKNKMDITQDGRIISRSIISLRFAVT